MKKTRHTEEQIAFALKQAETGTSVAEVSRSILDKLAMLRRPAESGPAVELSSREREVLDLICDDLDDTTIADRLGLSRNTVRNHVARLYARIGVNRRIGAVVWGAGSRDGQRCGSVTLEARRGVSRAPRRTKSMRKGANHGGRIQRRGEGLLDMREAAPLA